MSSPFPARGGSAGGGKVALGPPAPGGGSAGGGTVKLGPPAPTKTVNVRAHTRTVPVKAKPAPQAKTTAPITQTVTPGEASTAKRYKPSFPKEPVAGYDAVQVNPDGSVAKQGSYQPGVRMVKRPYYTNTNTLAKKAGPAGQESTQWNAATVAKAKQMQVANYGKPGYIARSLVPGGLEGGTSSVATALTRGVNAATLALPGGGVGEAAGLLTGLKGLKVLRGVKDVTEAAPKVAEALAPEAPAAAHATDAAAQVREGLKGSRSQYGVEKAARKEAQAAREKTAAQAFYGAKDPHAALAASGAALRGKYATIDYKGLKELTPDTVTQLMEDARNHPALGLHGKRTVMKALKAAVEDGRNPRPAELRLIETVFGKKTAAGIAEQAKRSWVDHVLNVANIPRTLQTTLDVSGLMRQNLVAMVSHPVLGARTLPVTFKAMRADGFEAAQQAVKDNPFYASAVQHGLQFTDIGEHTPMVAHEEGFGSDIAANVLDKARKVPNVIKGSARAYVAGGNTMRMAAYENRIRIAMAAGDQSIHQEKTLRQIAQVVNAATGRGTLPGRAEHLLPAMNTFMFSPRLMLARLHYLDPTWYLRLKGPARREALRGLFALSGSVTSALYLFSKIPGVHVNWNQPQNADWGKLRIGNTRIDIAGGFQQYIRLASELAPSAIGGGKTISSTTGKVQSLTSGKFGQPTRFDVVSNFLANKTNPALGLGIAGLRGHDPVGAPLTWGSVAQNYLTPLTFQDAKDIYNEKHGGMDGIAAAIAGYGLGATGIGLQTYPPKAPKPTSSGPFPSSSSSGGSSPFPSSSSGSGGSSPFP